MWYLKFYSVIIAQAPFLTSSKPISGNTLFSRQSLDMCYNRNKE